MDTLLQDIRFGARMLWKHRGATLAGVLALTLGRATRVDPVKALRWE